MAGFLVDSYIFLWAGETVTLGFFVALKFLRYPENFD